MEILDLSLSFLIVEICLGVLTDYTDINLIIPCLWDGKGTGDPLQYSCLENPIDRGAWWAPVHGVTKSRARLSDFTFTFHFHALEKEMATRSSVLAWRIPGTGEPGGLLSMGSHRVGHDWSDLAAAAAKGWWPWEARIVPSSSNNSVTVPCCLDVRVEKLAISVEIQLNLSSEKHTFQVS